MKSRAAVKGHPIHPMLVALPIGLLCGSFVSDLVGMITDNEKFMDAGGKLVAGGLLTGLAAAVPGVIDYTTIVPPESEAEDLGRNHALANTAVIALFGANALLRLRTGMRPVCLALSALGTGLLVYSGWLGGELVYRDQIGVDHLSTEGNEMIEFPSCEALAGDWVGICGLDDLKPGQHGLLVLNGERIALVRLKDGRAVAFSDHCTHLGGPLSDGTLIGESVLCPWHGSQFNVCTGAVECGPAEATIPTYEVRVQNNQIEVRAPAVKQRSLIDAGSLA